MKPAAVLASILMMFAALLLAAPESCVPKIQEEFPGKVISVTDGDTIRVLTSDQKSVIVRLEGIDAPEKGQDHGSMAAAELCIQACNKDVTVKKTGTDKYGRTLGYVFVGEREINLWQVENGWAWHFTKYNCEKRFKVAEDTARKNRYGLWMHANPIAPWDYRESKRSVTPMPLPDLIRIPK